MVSFRDATANAIRGSICAVIAVNDDASKLFGRVVPGLSTAADYFNFFAPLRTQVCDEDPDTYEPPAPPFAGGQCRDVYLVTLVTGNNDGSFNGPQTVRARGPIGGARIAQTGSTFVAELFCRGLNSSQTTCGPLGESAPGFYFIGQGGNNLNGGSVTVSSVVACGQDDCGDAPIPQPEPGPVTRPINITFNDGDDTEINIDGSIRFGPAFSIGDFNLRVPFNLDLGGLEWSGNLQLTPTLDLTFSPSFNFGGGASDDPNFPALPDPEDTEPVDPEPGEPLIIGVIVRAVLQGEQRASSIATENIPTIYAPRLGSVSFAINVGLVSAWTADIDIKSRDTYIPCPEPRGAVAVAASAAPGVDLTWTAVRGQPLS